VAPTRRGHRKLRPGTRTRSSLCARKFCESKSFKVFSRPRGSDHGRIPPMPMFDGRVMPRVQVLAKGPGRTKSFGRKGQAKYLPKLISNVEYGSHPYLPIKESHLFGNAKRNYCSVMKRSTSDSLQEAFPIKPRDNSSRCGSRLGTKARSLHSDPNLALRTVALYGRCFNNAETLYVPLTTARPVAGWEKAYAACSSARVLGTPGHSDSRQEFWDSSSVARNCEALAGRAGAETLNAQPTRSGANDSLRELSHRRGLASYPCGSRI